MHCTPDDHRMVLFNYVTACLDQWQSSSVKIYPNWAVRVGKYNCSGFTRQGNIVSLPALSTSPCYLSFIRGDGVAAHCRVQSRVLGSMHPTHSNCFWRHSQEGQRLNLFFHRESAFTGQFINCLCKSSLSCNLTWQDADNYDYLISESQSQLISSILVNWSWDPNFRKGEWLNLGPVRAHQWPLLP